MFTEIRTRLEFHFEESFAIGAVQEESVSVNGVGFANWEIFIDTGTETGCEIFRVAVWIGGEIEDFYVTLQEPSKEECRKYAAEICTRVIRERKTEDLKVFLELMEEVWEEMPKRY